MSKFLPDMYKKNIYEIDYKKLKKLGIKVIGFDFDNTLVEKGKVKDYEKFKNFFKKLKKDFKVYIISNTINKNKIKEFSSKCDVEYVMFALKPLSRGFRKLNEDKKYKNEEICMVGDQLLTDVYGSKKLGYYSVFLTPIAKDEHLITRFNRLIENKIFNKVLSKNNIEKGKYYD